jgi:hypothetical protein
MRKLVVEEEKLTRRAAEELFEQNFGASRFFYSGRGR